MYVLVKQVGEGLEPRWCTKCQETAATQHQALRPKAGVSQILRHHGRSWYANVCLASAGACVRTSAGEAARDCAAIAVDISCAAAGPSCRWSAGPSLEELRQLGPTILGMDPAQFQPPQIDSSGIGRPAAQRPKNVAQLEIQAAAAAPAEMVKPKLTVLHGNSIGAGLFESATEHISVGSKQTAVLRAARRQIASTSGSDCSDNTASLEAFAPGNGIPVAVPGSHWSLELAGCFANGDTASMSLDLSADQASPSFHTGWLQLQSSPPRLAGDVPVELGGTTKSVTVFVTAADGCGRTATLNLRIPVNSPPSATGIQPSIVVVGTGIGFHHERLHLDQFFADADDDLLSVDLRLANMPPAGEGDEDEATLPPFLRLAGDGWVHQRQRLSDRRPLELVVDESGMVPPATVQLTLFISDGQPGTSGVGVPLTVRFVQHCSVSEFSRWSKCSARCGGGSQRRSRSLVVPAEGEGADPCPVLDEIRRCNMEACETVGLVRLQLLVSGISLGDAQSRALDAHVAAAIVNMTGHSIDLIDVSLAASEYSEALSELAGTDASGNTLRPLPAGIRVLVSITVPVSSGVVAQALADIVGNPGAWKTGFEQSTLPTDHRSRHVRRLAAAVGLPLVFNVRETTVMSQSSSQGNEQPKARSRVVVVPSQGEDVVIPLDGIDGDGDSLTAYLFHAPAEAVGSVFQLSQVFSSYGYPPASGTQLAGLSLSKAVIVTGSLNRVVFRASTMLTEPAGHYGFLTHAVSDGTVNSAPGLTWLVPPHRRLVTSQFFLDASGWIVRDNSHRQAALPGGGIIHEAFADGALDRYVLGVEAAINPDAVGQDRNQWYFDAPPAFQGNFAGSYAGQLEVSIGVFEGNFDADADIAIGQPLIQLTCLACGGPAGVTLGHFATAAAIRDLAAMPAKYAVPLLAGSWRKKPAAINEAWASANECDIVAVLSGLTAFRIRGDLTTGHEAVGIDDVALVAPDAAARGLAGPDAVVVRRTAKDGLPVGCPMALTGDMASGGNSAISFTVTPS